ncbi:MAG: hypothetical protein LAO05_15890 [Acidobacteriia bacterium]|nr:hypothetical protein [Terriglobia bacterium]
MNVKTRWSLTAAIGLPFIAMTAYLLCVWPRPSGNSPLAVMGPYVVSLLTGLPFAWGPTRRSGRWWLLLAVFVSGFVLLWIYALAVLCGVRGVCL